MADYKAAQDTLLAAIKKMAEVPLTPAQMKDLAEAFAYAAVPNAGHGSTVTVQNS